jgi:RHS repeat-associated protein
VVGLCVVVVLAGADRAEAYHGDRSAHVVVGADGSVTAEGEEWLRDYDGSVEARWRTAGSDRAAMDITALKLALVGTVLPWASEVDPPMPGEVVESEICNAWLKGKCWYLARDDTDLVFGPYWSGPGTGVYAPGNFTTPDIENKHDIIAAWFGAPFLQWRELNGGSGCTLPVAMGYLRGRVHLSMSDFKPGDACWAQSETDPNCCAIPALRGVLWKSGMFTTMRVQDDDPGVPNNGRNRVPWLWEWRSALGERLQDDDRLRDWIGHDMAPGQVDDPYAAFPPGPKDDELYGGSEGSPAAPNRVGCHAGDPVDCATGNFSETQHDLAVGGLGDLGLSRTYNAQAAADASAPGRFGYGWADPFGQHLRVDDDAHTVGVVDAQGAVTGFLANGDGTYAAAPRVQAVLVHDGDGTYEYTLPDRSSLRFADNGRLLQLRDSNDNGTDLGYDGSGRVTTATAPGGRAISFAYNGDGTVASAASTAGREVHYAYDGGDLTSVTDARGSVWHFAYDGQHRLTQVEDPRGHDTQNTYDAGNRVTEQVDRSGQHTTWDYGASSTTVTDPEGHVKEITFEHNLPTRIVTAKGTAQEATKLISYDAASSPIAVTDARGQVWSYSYDHDGNRTSATDPMSRTTRWSYDDHHDLLTRTLPSGLQTTYDHDAHGNVTSITRHPGAGDEQTTTLAYDAAGNLSERTDALGHSWTYAHNADGDLTSATSPLGHQTSYSHDDDGLVTSSVSPRGHLAGADPADFTTTYQRDGAGQPTTITDALGHDTVLAYDANGNLTSSTDPDGRETQTTYDADDRPTSVRRADGSTLHAGYDANGLTTSQTDGEGHQTAYARDAQGRVSTVTDPNDRSTHYEYDAVGNRTAVIDPDGRTTSLTYDQANELAAISYSSGHPGRVYLTYTPDGLRSSMTDDSGQSTWSYDAQDRLIASKNGAAQSVGYHYDIADRLTSIDYPDALVPGPPNATPSTVAAGTVTRSYDADDRLTAVEDWLEYETTFSYNADDALTSTERPDGTTADQSVDREDRPLAIDDAGAHYGYSVDYTRTDAGLLATASETGDGAATAAAAYAHDDAGRLTATGAANQSYSYDAADNPTQLTDGPVTHNQAFDDANQLTAITDAAHDPLGELHYDAEGDRTSLTPTTGTATSYGYDQARQLTQYQGPDTSGSLSITQTYGYNGDGLRQYTQTDGTRTRHTWDESGGLPVMIQDGATSYVYGPDGIPVEQITAAGQTRYYHHDQLGSTRALTDQDGQPVATYSYTPYGALKASTGSATNPFGYAGQYTDATGLQYLRARYYDPATAQFITRDPLEAQTGQPYGYAASDPTDLVDPEGAFPHLPSFQNVADAAAGYGDAITGGATKWARQKIGSDGTDYCSTAYLGGEVAGAVAGAMVGGEGAAAERVAARVWPKTAKGMDEALGFPGTRVPDGPFTPGRGKVQWTPNSDTTITYERHPYHPDGPDWHRNPHWHLDTPGNPHQRYMPGDPFPGQ